MIFIKNLRLFFLALIYALTFNDLLASDNPWQLPFDLSHARTIQTLELERIRSPFSKTRDSLYKRTWKKTQNMESDLILDTSQIKRLNWEGEIRFPIYCLRFLTQFSDSFDIQKRESGERIFKAQSKSSPFKLAITNPSKHTAMYTINDNITIKESYYLDRKNRTVPQTQRIFWYFEQDEQKFRISWTIRFVDLGFFPASSQTVQKAGPLKLDRDKYEGLLKQLRLKSKTQ